ncbi:hypothetical protein LP43_0195 [Methylophaga thiooxydans]|uniref:Uncharacterized protein n=1 Tax=Methylophaga thiooxydans TaxID=392484 RepID=A0A0A0BL20_9GAMM|nr:hypothetical protein [Methylophaga thiooxydans]KGM07779.1 hypothetical protein LP43_0195 [Methylophaga thiooxydans]
MLRGLLLSLSVLLLSPVAQAFECFEPSPVYLSLGEQYFESDDDRIQVQGNEKKLEVLEKLKGEWAGQLSELICEGSEDQPEPYYREGEVEADIRPSNTALLLMSLSKEYNSHYFEGDKVFLMNKGSMFSLRINDDYAMAHERERRGHGGIRHGSRFVEVFSEVFIHTADTITVEWVLFSNGVFVYSQRLVLERD